MGDDRQRQYRRVGDTAKCPACGVPMDPAAYRCPRCLIYFCFKCRRRIQQRDPQFQCMNQQCEQYGKMLCNACIVEVPQMADRDRQVLVKEGKEGPILPGKVLWVAYFVIIGAAIVAGFYLSALAGLIFGGYVVYFLASLTIDRQPVYRTVTENVEVGRSKCCIACRQAVQHL